MNDIGYIQQGYKGSILFNSLRNSKDCLLNQKRYTQMAISHHTEGQNQSQVEFFTQHLTEINKRLKRLKNGTIKSERAFR